MTTNKEIDNLPQWPSASAVYSKAYRKLEQMAQAGHASRGSQSGRGWRGFSGKVSPEMADLIDALNRGDEERIKAILLYG